MANNELSGDALASLEVKTPAVGIPAPTPDDLKEFKAGVIADTKIKTEKPRETAQTREQEQALSALIDRESPSQPILTGKQKADAAFAADVSKETKEIVGEAVKPSEKPVATVAPKVEVTKEEKMLAEMQKEREAIQKEREAIEAAAKRAEAALARIEERQTQLQQKTGADAAATSADVMATGENSEAASKSARQAGVSEANAAASAASSNILAGNASISASVAESSAVRSENAAVAADSSAVAAAGSATVAQNTIPKVDSFAQTAQGAAQRSESSAVRSENAAIAADGSAVAAAGSATEAKGTIPLVKDSADAAERSANKSETFAGRSEQFANNSQTSAGMSAINATNASASASAADGSATRAASSETNAATSAADAANSQTGAREAAVDSRAAATDSEISKQGAQTAQAQAETARNASGSFAAAAAGAALQSAGSANNSAASAKEAQAAEVAGNKILEATRLTIDLPRQTKSLSAAYASLEDAQMKPIKVDDFDLALVTKEGGTYSYGEIMSFNNKTAKNVPLKSFEGQERVNVCTTQQGRFGRTYSALTTKTQDVDGTTFIPQLADNATVKIDKNDFVLLDSNNFAEGQRINVKQGGVDDNGKVMFLVDANTKLTSVEKDGKLQLTMNGKTVVMSGIKAEDVLLVSRTTDSSGVQVAADKVVPLNQMIAAQDQKAQAEQETKVAGLRKALNGREQEFLLKLDVDLDGKISTAEAQVGQSLMGNKGLEIPGLVSGEMDKHLASIIASNEKNKNSYAVLDVPKLLAEPSVPVQSVPSNGVASTEIKR